MVCADGTRSHFFAAQICPAKAVVLFYNLDKSCYAAYFVLAHVTIRTITGVLHACEFHYPLFLLINPFRIISLPSGPYSRLIRKGRRFTLIYEGLLGGLLIRTRGYSEYEQLPHCIV